MSHLTSLPVQSRHTIRANGSVRVERLVYCADAAGWVLLARCRNCAACAHLSEGSRPVVVCEVGATPASAEDESVREHLASSVWCIEADAPAKLARVLPEAQPEAVVIDRDGHAIGLLARTAATGAVADELARSLMDPTLVALFEGAPFERAQALLAGGVRTLPVLAGGRVVGCVAVAPRATGRD